MTFLRFILISVVCDCACAGDDNVDDTRFASLARIVRAAHTTDLPEIDRIEIHALSIDSQDVRSPNLAPKTFLVRPAMAPEENGENSLGAAEITVTSHAAKSVTGSQAKQIAKNWRSLKFQPNGAFCHIPAYGLSFFRDDKLIFRVSVCWKCQNFYVPTIDSKTGQASVLLYGFDDNAAAKKLLNELRRIVPHPEIKYPRL